MKSTVALPTYYEKLNRDITNYYPHITPITPEMNTTFKGVSRTVMLDRYAFKDTERLTLSVGDLVVLTYKDDPKFPKRGYGEVVDIDYILEEVTVELDPQFEGGMTITVTMDKIDKPLELFYEQIADRVARGLAEIEDESTREESHRLFYGILSDLSFVPAGRVLMGAGSGQGVTYFNCYVMPFIHDSRGGIADHRKMTMEIMSRGGGVGTNGSTLRPRNALAKGVNGKSSGSVTWLHDLSQLTNTVEQGGSRRGAQMIMLNSWHPDVVEFIISKMQNPKVLRFIIENTKSKLIREEAERKLKFTPLAPSEKRRLEYYVASMEISMNYASYGDNTLSKEDKQAYYEAKELLEDGGSYSVHKPDFLEGANISVCLTKEFMDAVENKTMYQLQFPDVDNYDTEMRRIYNEDWQQCGDIRAWEKRGYALRTYYEIEAVELWDLINTCATYSAEPGIFFLDTANEMTNASSYGQKVVATNP